MEDLFGDIKIETILCVVDVNNGIVLAGDTPDIRVDRLRAALDGLTPEPLTGALRSWLYGNVTTQVRRGPKMVGVRVWIPDTDCRTIYSIFCRPLWRWLPETGYTSAWRGLSPDDKMNFVHGSWDQNSSRFARSDNRPRQWLLAQD